MTLSKRGIICSLLGLGGLTATITGITLGGAFKAATSAATILKKRRKWPDDYKNRCYKWVYYDSATDGELQACEDKNSLSTTNSPSLRFYLWWLKGGEGATDWNRRFEVEKITGVDSSDSISFIFKNNKYGSIEKKLKIHPKAPSDLKNSVKALVNTNGNLKDICSVSSVDGKWTLNCKDTDGSKSASVHVQQVDAYF